MFYGCELVLDERFASRSSCGMSLAFTFVNRKVSVGALGVNMLTCKPLLKDCRNTAIGGTFAKNHE